MLTHVLLSSFLLSLSLESKRRPFSSTRCGPWPWLCCQVVWIDSGVSSDLPFEFACLSPPFAVAERDRGLVKSVPVRKCVLAEVQLMSNEADLYLNEHLNESMNAGNGFWKKPVIFE